MTDVEQQAADAAAKAAEAKKADVARRIEELKALGVKIYADDDMQEAINRRQEALEKLRLREEADKKLEEERQRKAGEFEKMYQTEKLAKEKAEKDLNDLKPLADQAKKYRDSIVAKAKEKLGDKWLPEYETFSLESLGKLVPDVVVGTENARGGPAAKTDVKSMDQKAFDQLQNDVMSGKKVTLQ